MTVTFPRDFRSAAEMFPRVSAAVLNRTAQESRTLVKNYVTQNYNIKPSEITSVAIKKANKNNLVAVIAFSKKLIPPILFATFKKPTTRREPVILEIKKGVKRLVDTKWFIQRGRKSGKVNIFTQEGDDRTHLTMMKFFRISGLLQSKALLTTWDKFAKRRIETELPRVLKAFREIGRET